MSTSFLLILLASDTLTSLYIHPETRSGEEAGTHCSCLLPKIRRYRHVTRLTVVSVTLNYFFSSHVKSGTDEHRIQELIRKIKKDGIEIPQDYRFKRVALDRPGALSKAELKHARVNQFTALITDDPRYDRQSRSRVRIWNIEQLFARLALEYSLQLPASTKSNSQVDQHFAQTSEEAARREASLSRVRTLVVRLLIAVLGNHLLRSDRPSKSQSSQASKESVSSDVAQKVAPSKFHAPTTSHLDNNTVSNTAENTIKQAIINTLGNSNHARLDSLVNQGGHFFGLGLLSQVSTNYDRSNSSSFDLAQQSFVSPPLSSVQNYDLGALRNLQNNGSQGSNFPNRAAPGFIELDLDRVTFILKPFVFVGRDFDNLDVTEFNVIPLLKSNPLAETPRSPSLSNQTNLAVSNRGTESVNQPSDRPTLSTDVVTPQELEKPTPIVAPEIVGITPPQILDGFGGSRLFTLTTGHHEIKNFGGVGTSRNPSEEIIREVDTLYFEGEYLTAKNLSLDQQGNDLVMTFEDVQNTSTILKNFDLENLDNFLTTTKNPFMLGNIMFNGETSVQDSFDVIDANLVITQVFNRNSVTFLNNSANNVTGFDDSNDVINGQGGDDFLKGLGGNDVLRGGVGNDIIWGGTGADILDGGTGNNWLTGGADADTFRLCRGGLSQVTDFQVGNDRIGLPIDIQLDQVSIEQGTGLNSSSTLIRFKLDGSVLMSLAGVTASSLTTDIFLPNASSLMKK